MLQAKTVKIIFNKDQELENIYGENQVRFTKGQIQGSSKKVNWDYQKEIMLFLDSAQLKSQNKGITRGDRLRLDLKDDKITILSDLQNRSETIIE
jgi:lipopolysaccharide export system protein LptA